MQNKLKEIQDRANKATIGPWVYMGETKPYEGMVLSSGNIDRICGTVGLDDRPNDMEFIAHSREDIPYLLAALKDEEKESKEYRKALFSCIKVIEKLGDIGIEYGADSFARHEIKIITDLLIKY